MPRIPQASQPMAAARYGPQRARRYDVRARRWEATFGCGADRAIDDAIVAATRAPVTVLDIGAGTGRNLVRLRRLRRPVLDYRGEDIAPAMLAAAARHSDADGRVRFSHGDGVGGTAVGLADLVLCTWVASHVGDPVRLLTRAHRQVAPGGTLVVAAVTTPFHGRGAVAANVLASRWGVSPVPSAVLEELQPRTERMFLGGALTVATWDSIVPSQIVAHGGRLDRPHRVTPMPTPSDLLPNNGATT